MYCLLWQQNKKHVRNNTYLNEKIERIVPTIWEEHCLECSPPECYKSCEKFLKREDGACIRVNNGISVDETISGTYGYAAKISFREWAKIEILYREKTVSIKENYRIEKIIQFLDKVFKASNHLFALSKDRWGVFHKWELFRQKFMTYLTRNGKEDANAVVIDVVSEKAETLMMEIKTQDAVVFRKALDIKPGENSFIEYINTRELNRIPQRKYIYLYPAEYNKEHSFSFKTLELAKVKKEKTVKCVVWDLDNTLWDGVFVDDGYNVAVREKVIKIIEDFERKGIVNCICSKNDYEDINAFLMKRELDKYFIIKKINWNPKSENIKDIVKRLNIGIDTVAFFDDSEYERNEVSQNAVGVRCYDIAELDDVIKRESFNPPVSKDSSKRKEQYIENLKRYDEIEKNGGDIVSFLKNAEMELEIKPGCLENVDRYYEIIQRTNQLNVSVRRLTREEIIMFVESNQYDFWQIRLKDKYGDYGIVGIANINKEKQIVEDLLFSCRAAMKMVEENFAVWMLKQYTDSNKSLKINYMITDRNKPLIEKIESIGFKSNGSFLEANSKLLRDIELPFEINIIEDVK